MFHQEPTPSSLNKKGSKFNYKNLYFVLKYFLRVQMGNSIKFSQSWISCNVCIYGTQGRAKSLLSCRAKYWLAPLYALSPNYCGHNIFSRFKVFLQKEIIGIIINSLSRFWDITKIQCKKKKKKIFNARLYNTSSYLI